MQLISEVSMGSITRVSLVFLTEREREKVRERERERDVILILRLSTLLKYAYVMYICTFYSMK